MINELSFILYLKDVLLQALKNYFCLQGTGSSTKFIRFKGVVQSPEREDSMEPVMPASARNGSGSPQQQSQNSVTSDQRRKSSGSQGQEAEDLFLNSGIVMEDTDSEESDVEQNTARAASQGGKDASPPRQGEEPFLDEEEVKGELGGDFSPTGTFLDVYDCISKYLRGHDFKSKNWSAAK